MPYKYGKYTYARKGPHYDALRRRHHYRKTMSKVYRKYRRGAHPLNTASIVKTLGRRYMANGRLMRRTAREKNTSRWPGASSSRNVYLMNTGSKYINIGASLYQHALWVEASNALKGVQHTDRNVGDASSIVSGLFPSILGNF